MTSTSQRDRLNQIRERTTSARTRRAAAQKAIDASRQANDQQALLAAEVAMQRAVGELDVARELEAVVLGQMAGVSGAAMLGGDSLFDDPDTVRALEQLGHSQMPIGNLNLGPIAGRDEVIAMIESGNWGPSRRMASSGFTPVDPSLPDDTRLGPFYGVVTQLRRRLRLLDIVPVLPMDGLMFHYAIESGSLDQAWETDELSLKPQGDQTLSDGVVEAKTIAAWQKIARQQLSDVPMLSLAVSNRLTYSVMRRVENALVAGDGTGDNLTGIINTLGISNVAYTADTALADLALEGIVDVLAADAEPNAVVLSPADWGSMLQAKASGSGERLDSNGAMSTTADTLWGLPAIISTVMPPGQCLVGDFTRGATIFVREGVLLRISDSDQDDFLRNRVTMLAEGRFGLAVWRPACFATVAFASTGGASGGSGGSGDSIVFGPSGSTGP